MTWEVTNGALPVYYRKMGSGPALLLVHGFPESSAMWEYVQDELSASYTLIMPDLPGSGKSQGRPGTGMTEMAECINGILDAENVNKAVIGGHSMGGYVALEFASRYPGKVAGLSLIHSTPLADDEAKKAVRQRSMEIIRNGGKGSFISQMMGNLFTAGFKQNNAVEVNKHVGYGMEVSVDNLINFYQAMIDRKDHTGLLRNAFFPVQWIAGADDAIIDYKKIMELCYLPAISFTSLYAGCGHMSMIEHPDRLQSDLTKFSDYCNKYP